VPALPYQAMSDLIRGWQRPHRARSAPAAERGSIGRANREPPLPLRIARAAAVASQCRGRFRPNWRTADPNRQRARASRLAQAGQNRATRQRSQPRSPRSRQRLLTSAAEVLLPTLPNARLQLRHTKRGCAALACVPRPRVGSQNRARRACGRPTPPSSSRAGESRRVRDCCKRSCVAPAAARRSACSTGRETPPPRPIPAGVAVTYARRRSRAAQRARASRRAAERHSNARLEFRDIKRGCAALGPAETIY
jgi:hypothetical protein